MQVYLFSGETWGWWGAGGLMLPSHQRPLPPFIHLLGLSVRPVRKQVHKRGSGMWHLSRCSPGGDIATFVNSRRGKLKNGVRFSHQPSLERAVLSAPLRYPTLLCRGAWFAVCWSSGGAKHYLPLNKSKASQQRSNWSKGNHVPNSWLLCSSGLSSVQLQQLVGKTLWPSAESRWMMNF